MSELQQAVEQVAASTEMCELLQALDLVPDFGLVLLADAAVTRWADRHGMAFGEALDVMRGAHRG